jgi:hypothetical protein
MALSRLAEAFAAEICNHDWSDAPWRADRAGHDRSRAAIVAKRSRFQRLRLIVCASRDVGDRLGSLPGPEFRRVRVR